MNRQSSALIFWSGLLAMLLVLGALAPRADAAGPTSLLAVTTTHLHQAQARMPGAQLFEVHTTIQAADVALGTVRIPFVVSDFTSPGNDVYYMSIGQWFTGATMRTSVDERIGFVRVECNGGAPRPDCGADTGRPEPRRQHLPLLGWKVDLGGIVRILRSIRYVSTNYSNITVTTAGRARATTPVAPAALGSLALAQPVILVREAAIGRSHYVVINATTGAVIDQGTALVAPPPSGAPPVRG
jgi:hypothetical protein